MTQFVDRANAKWLQSRPFGASRPSSLGVLPKQRPRQQANNAVLTPCEP